MLAAARMIGSGSLVLPLAAPLKPSFRALPAAASAQPCTQRRRLAVAAAQQAAVAAAAGVVRMLPCLADCLHVQALLSLFQHQPTNFLDAAVHVLTPPLACRPRSRRPRCVPM